MNLQPPDSVVWIARTLEERGFSTWAVGGAVRDALTGGRPQDWDLTTAARPADIQRIFRRTVPIGIDYGTVGVIARNGRMYEVTTFRRDVETFGRKARVAFSDSLEEDLERRDFTINAVAWHPLTGEVRDPHGGMRDLERGVLRTVGDPGQRFAEDRLRALRALRFAGRFSLEIAADTWGAIRDSADKLGNLSAERIREELWKVVEDQYRPSRSLRLYGESGVLAALYPELEACRKVTSTDLGADLWDMQLRAMDASSPRKRTVRLAALLHGIARGQLKGEEHLAAGGETAGRSAAMARDILRRLRASNSDIDTVTHLIAQHAPVPPSSSPDPELRRWVRIVGREHLNDLFRLLIAICRARGKGSGEEGRELLRLWLRAAAIRRSAVPLSIADLAIDGSDIRTLGIPPGPLYGEILRDLLENVIDDPGLNERGRLLALVESRLSSGG